MLFNEMGSFDIVVNLMSAELAVTVCGLISHSTHTIKVLFFSINF